MSHKIECWQEPCPHQQESRQATKRSAKPRPLSHVSPGSGRHLVIDPVLGLVDKSRPGRRVREADMVKMTEGCHG